MMTLATGMSLDASPTRHEVPAGCRWSRSGTTARPNGVRDHRHCPIQGQHPARYLGAGSHGDGGIGDDGAQELGTINGRGGPHRPEHIRANAGLAIGVEGYDLGTRHRHQRRAEFKDENRIVITLEIKIELTIHLQIGRG